MITMIARMQVPPENAAEYEAIVIHVTQMSLEYEPGVVYYAWAKSADEPDVYLVVEVYRDEKAQAAHMATDWVQQSLPVSKRLVTGKFDIKQYVTPGQQPITLRHAG